MGRPDLVFKHKKTGEVLIVEIKVTDAEIPDGGWPNLRAQLWAYSLADAFATAALARFRIHGFEDWWRGTALEDYYGGMKARPSFKAAEVIDTGSERDL